MDGQSLQAPGWILLDIFSPPISMALPPFVTASWFSPQEDLAVSSTKATGLLPSSSDIFKAQNTPMWIHHPFVPWIHLRGRIFPDIGSLLAYVVPVYATSATTHTRVSQFFTFYLGSLTPDHHPHNLCYQLQTFSFGNHTVFSYIWYPLQKL